MISEILWLASNIKNIHQPYTLSNWSRCFSCRESFISDFVPPRKVSIISIISLLCDSSILKNYRAFDWYIICSIFTSVWKIDLFEIHSVLINKKKINLHFYWFSVKHVEFSGKERANVLRNMKTGSWIGDLAKMVKLKILNNV